jgi:hypothetical protein
MGVRAMGVKAMDVKAMGVKAMGVKAIPPSGWQLIRRPMSLDPRGGRRG